MRGGPSRSITVGAMCTGLPDELLDEVAAAWERAKAPLLSSFELGFDSAPSVRRAWGELRLPDGTVVARLRASEALALACGDMVLQAV
jgi:hypothetical protein